ncbi:MAG: hypothetical protein A3G23_01765 [Bacteroidetes bacterium RIFCSPLOWO2_12_FULL_37_12]|nr:MAG: hypothetical protein A3G23_01765 [Bacteroidetes bacterium RIFCSPLOWO2_12_FULL_37_12]
MKHLLLNLTFILISKIAFSQTFLTEDFTTASGSTPPTGWTANTVSGTVNDVWHFDNPGNRTLGKSPSGAPFAIFDGANYSNDGSAETVELISPTFSLSGQNIVTLRFFEYFEGGFGGQGEVFASKDDGVTWTSIYQNSTTSSSNPSMIVLDGLNAVFNKSNICKVKFTWSGNNSFWWLLDDIQLYKPPAQDVGALSANNLVRNCVVSLQQPLTATFRNYGTGNATVTTFNYILNNNPVVSDTANMFIGKGLDSTFTFPTLMNLQEGVNIIKIFPNSDQDPINDTLIVQTTVNRLQVANLPFIENFESGTFQVSMCANTGNSGNGRIRILDTTASCGGNKMLVMDSQNTGSTIDDLDLLVDLSSCVDKTLTFTYGHANETNDPEDGLYISVDNGSSFTKIFNFMFDTLASDTCYSVTLNLDSIARNLGFSLSGESLLRWQHAGNNSFESGTNGFYLDNISINLAGLQYVDAGISTVVLPSVEIYKDSTFDVTVYVKNFPTSPDTLVAVNVNFQFGNNPVVTEFKAGCMQIGDSSLFTFANPLITNSTLGQYKLCMWTSIPQNLNMVELNKSNDTICMIVDVKCSPVKTNFNTTNTCLGDSTLFNNTSTSNAINWKYDFGDSTISVLKIPAHKYAEIGNYNVKLIAFDNKGCSDTIQKNISVLPVPVADFSSDVVCQGIATSFTNSSSNDSIYFYDFGDGIGNSSNENPTYVYSVAGSYNVTLTTTADNGCTNKITKGVLVNSLPTVYAGKDTLLNCGQNINLSAIASGGITPYSYFWNNGVTSAGNNNAGAGNYFVVVTDGNNCMGSDTVSVLLNSNLKLTKSNDTLVCFGTNATLFVNLIGGTPPYTYSWNNGITTSSITVNSGVYTISVTDAGGCRLTDFIAVTDNPLLAVNLGTDKNICFSKTIMLNATVNGGDGSYTYLWNTGETMSSVSKGGGTFSLQVTDGVGCKDSDTLKINENSLLTVNTGSDTTICKNDLITLIANATGGSGNYNYSWNNNANTQTVTVGSGIYSVQVSDLIGCTAVDSIFINPGVSVDAGVNQAIPCGQTANLTANATGGDFNYNYLWSNGVTTANNDSVPAGFYSVTVSDGLGCSYNDSVQVFLLGSNLAVKVLKDTVLCKGETVTLSVQVTGGTAPYMYKWNTMQTSPLLFVSTEGNFQVTVTDSSGCIASDYVTVTIENTTATFTSSADITGDTINIKNNPTVSFFNQSTGAVTYLWSFGNGNTSTLINPTATYTASGSVTVTLISFTDHQCSDTAKKVLIIKNTTGVGENFPIEEGNDIIEIYPNPVSQHSILRISTPLEKIINLKLTNLNGKEILNIKSSNFSKDNNGIYAELPELPSGMYIISIQAKDKLRYAKVNIF